MLDTETATDVVQIEFPAGLPGFPNAHRFELAPWGPAGSPFLMLTGSPSQATAHPSKNLPEGVWEPHVSS